MKQNRQGFLWVTYNKFLKVLNAGEIIKRAKIAQGCLGYR